jgi:hypothetical protein
MMPDITPWSYPNKNTPNDTKMEVKYLGSATPRQHAKAHHPSARPVIQQGIREQQ